MEHKKSLSISQRDFKSSIIPALCEYVKIPNLSPEYDPEWKTNGKLEEAGNHLIKWAENQGIKGLKASLIKEPDRTPLVFLEVAPTDPSINKTILLYGHFDKQPHMDGWMEGLGPLTPVIRDGYLYGRGASDDGYALFSIVESIKIIQEQNGKHGKIFVTVEGGEESGSPDLMYYLNKLKDTTGEPDMMVCMDSGCVDYDTLWLTTSLRGVSSIDLTVECLDESVHSGSGSGIAPDSFTIMRELLDRLEDSKTSKVISELHVEIPNYCIEDAKKLAELSKEKVVTEVVKLKKDVKALNDDYSEIILNNTWRPMMTIVGMSGFPPAETAGNVLRAKTTCRISMRLPPTLDSKKADEIMVKKLTENPPYNAKVTAKANESGCGWAQKELCEKIKNSFSKSSMELFGKDFYGFGEGGSIPFIHELGALYPKCDMLVTGILGPKSNAHCPNECLNLEYTEKITVALAHVINDYSS